MISGSTAGQGRSHVGLPLQLLQEAKRAQNSLGHLDFDTLSLFISTVSQSKLNCNNRNGNHNIRETYCNL